MSILGIVPARYDSTRFPGKPLIKIGSKTMVELVYEQAKKCKHLKDVIVATDDVRIYDHVLSFGGNVILTSKSHQSGTDRCAEVVEELKTNYTSVINIQGDEPFIDPEQISLVAASLIITNSDIVTLAKKIETVADLFNENKVKVVMDKNDFAIYFSRAPIPFQKENKKDNWLQNHNYYKHIGMYGFKIKTLLEITKLSVSELEKTESLEQLRWIDNGYKIRVEHTEIETDAIDTESDYQSILNKLKNKSV
jgi:3-deoxy-manno-octulosonate cytidylyltransferase (CMP-KDO synthetase)